jgi:hypothetical protein
MSAARVSRAQQQRARIKVAQANLKAVVEDERDAFLQEAAQVEHDYLEVVARRKKFVKDFLDIAQHHRPAMVMELANAMGLSKQRLYQIGNSD